MPDDPHGRRRRVTRPLAALLGVFSALVALVLALAGPASAATGYGFDGQDPYSAGCWNSSAFIVNSVPIYAQNGTGQYATGYLWYSNSCGTNWVSVTMSRASSGSSDIVTDVLRQSPAGEQDYIYRGGWPAGGRSWSNMVYAPVSCAKGLVGFSTAGTYGITNVYQNSCRF